MDSRRVKTIRRHARRPAGKLDSEQLRLDLLGVYAVCELVENILPRSGRVVLTRHAIRPLAEVLERLGTNMSEYRHG